MNEKISTNQEATAKDLLDLSEKLEKKIGEDLET